MLGVIFVQYAPSSHSLDIIVKVHALVLMHSTDSCPLLFLSLLHPDSISQY